MRKFLTAAVAAAALAAPAAAQAHVTLQPSEAPAGGFTRLDVRVPNERDDAATTKIALQLPDGFAFASYEPVPGWKVRVQKAKLPEPVKTDDGEVSEGVKLITWTSKTGIPAGALPGLRPVGQCRARPATRSRSKRSRPTATARSCAGSARRAPTTRRRPSSSPPAATTTTPSPPPPPPRRRPRTTAAAPTASRSPR